MASFPGRIRSRFLGLSHSHLPSSRPAIFSLLLLLPLLLTAVVAVVAVAKSKVDDVDNDALASFATNAQTGLPDTSLIKEGNFISSAFASFRHELCTLTVPWVERPLAFHFARMNLSILFMIFYLLIELNVMPSVLGWWTQPLHRYRLTSHKVSSQSRQEVAHFFFHTALGMFIYHYIPLLFIENYFLGATFGESVFSPFQATYNKIMYGYVDESTLNYCHKEEAFRSSRIIGIPEFLMVLKAFIALLIFDSFSFFPHHFVHLYFNRYNHYNDDVDDSYKHDQDHGFNKQHVKNCDESSYFSSKLLSIRRSWCAEFRALLNRAHHVHHQSTPGFLYPWSGFYGHWLENFSALLFFGLPLYVTMMNWEEKLFGAFTMAYLAAELHSGYNLPFHIRNLKFLPQPIRFFFHSSVGHYLHHRFAHRNLSTFFSIFDRLYGTEATYEEYLLSQSENDVNNKWVMSRADFDGTEEPVVTLSATNEAKKVVKTTIETPLKKVVKSQTLDSPKPKKKKKRTTKND